MVRETDKVIEVPKNIDEMIMQYAEDPNRTTEGWKRFKDLIYHKYEDGTYQFITYAEEKDAATYYKKVYPELESQLSKVYSRKYNSSTLNVLPNIEYFVRSANEGGTPETYAYTIFMPEDKAIEDYFKNTILKYTSNINNLPSLVLNTFLGSHFSRSLVWPGKYKTAKNITGAEGEFFNGAGVNGPSFEDAEIISSQFASNGIVYRTKKVIKSGLFESVYGRILLDPEYSFIYLLLGDGTLYEKLTTSSYTGYSGDSYNYTLLIPSNTLLKSDGFSYNSQSSAFQNSENTNIDAYARLSRLVNSGIFIREVNGDNKPDILNDFSSQPPALNGAYDGYGYLVNNYGDIIRYKNNQLQAIGNIEDGTFVTIEKDPYTYCNGQIYTIDRLLNYSPRETLGGTDEGWNQKTVESFLSEYLNSHSDASVFKAYYNQCNGEIEFNSSSFYTLLIPTNERMNEAIELGYLPTLSDVSTTSNGELLKAVAFLN